MRGLKSGLAALVLIVGMTDVASAQQKSAPASATSAYPGSQINGTGGNGFYAMYPGAINYGLSGTYPTNGGYGYAGFGPGPQFGAHYPASVTNLPRTSDHPGSPVGGIKKQAGKPGNGTTKAITRPRKGL